MAARSELRHRLLEVKTAAMGWLAPRVLSNKTSGIDGMAKRMALKGAPASDEPLDPDLEHPDTPEIDTSSAHEVIPRGSDAADDRHG